MNKTALIAMILLSGSLIACSTTPPPDVICSETWIETRADKAVSKIEARSRKAFSALRSAGATWVEGKSPGPLQMYRLSRSLDALRTELTEGQGIKDLRLIAETCSEPELIRTELSDMLDRQEIPSQLSALISDIIVYAAEVDVADD